MLPLGSSAFTKAVMGETITDSELGGPAMHEAVAGKAHFVCSSDQDALRSVR